MFFPGKQEQFSGSCHGPEAQKSSLQQQSARSAAERASAVLCSHHWDSSLGGGTAEAGCCHFFPVPESGRRKCCILPEKPVCDNCDLQKEESHRYLWRYQERRFRAVLFQTCRRRLECGFPAGGVPA